MLLDALVIRGHRLDATRGEQLFAGFLCVELRMFNVRPKAHGAR